MYLFDESKRRILAWVGELKMRRFVGHYLFVAFLIVD
jgi:hypothetical protein